MRAAMMAIGLSLCLAGEGVAASNPAPENRAYAPYIGQLEPTSRLWFEHAFDVYKTAFIDNGRVFDPQNRGITHSEGQGYGMMLALMGNDRATFSAIWHFARTKMRRADGLFAWKYVPGRGVTDWNNATDGDLFIATALALAAYRWQAPQYLADAVRIAETVGRKLVIRHGGYTLLLPGEWARPNRDRQSAIVNFSYIVPMTLKVMDALAPQYPWAEIQRDSVRILDDMAQPPSDWTEVSASGEPTPARGFPQMFSYDAVRIPLYFMQFGQELGKTADRLHALWGPTDEAIFSFDVETIRPVSFFGGKSYELVHDMMECRRSGRRVSTDMLQMDMENYYDSSLHLMALGALFALYPQCQPG